MKKKIAAFVLAAALVLPTSLTAFAATPTDVVGKKEQSAVEELIALGVIKGYEDGTFKPESDITRAELAKVIVIASGNEGAATLMAGVKPSFADVKAGAWYTGYINAASAKGFILGDKGTKNFRPSANVKFEEAVAILVRALGYQESKLSGAWPYNYLLKAQDVGLFNDVTITAGALANRGVVAKLASNTINSTTVTYDVNGNEVTLGNPKLIAKIGNTSSAVVSAPNLDSDKKVSLNGVATATADGFVVTGGKALADLVGHTVTVVKTKDGSKVLAVTDAQAADKIVAIENGAAADVVNYGLAITDKNSKSYTAVANTKYLGFYSNFVTQALGGNLAASAKATLFLNADGEVQFVSVVTYTENKLFSTYEAKTSFRDARINLVGGGLVSLKDTAVVKLDGKLASATDLKENDVIRYVVTAGTDVAVVEATRNTVTGKIEKVKNENGTLYYTISGKDYKDVSGAAALTLGSEYTLFINKDGESVGSKSITASTSSNYAVAVKAATAGVSIVENGEIKGPFTKLEVFSVKENKVVTVYLAAADIDNTLGADYVPADNDVLKLTYNGEGKVTAAAQVGSAAGGNVVSEVTSTYVKATSTFIVNSNTVYLDATKRTDDTVSIATAAQITKNDVVAFIANSNGINADVVILVTDADAADASSAVYGTFVSKYEVATSATTTNYYVVLNVNGEQKTFSVTSGVYTGVATPAKFAVVKLEDAAAKYGEYDAQAVTTAAVTAINSADLTNSTFTVNGDAVAVPAVPAVPYIVTSKTVVYVVDKDNNVAIGSISDIKDASTGVIGTDIDLYVTDSGSDVGMYNEASAVVVKKLK